MVQNRRNGKSRLILKSKYIYEHNHTQVCNIFFSSAYPELYTYWVNCRTNLKSRDTRAILLMNMSLQSVSKQLPYHIDAGEIWLVNLFYCTINVISVVGSLTISGWNQLLSYNVVQSSKKRQCRLPTFQHSSINSFSFL